jgi:nickel/cobalt exporter
MRIALLLMLVAAPAALAHPLPNLRFDRAVHVRVGASGVTVKYALELNEWTMAIDGNRVLKGEDTAGLTGRLAYAKAYAARKAPLLADGLRAKLGGVPLEFRATRVEVEPDRDHLRMRFEFAAPFPANATGGAFAFEDQNFEAQAGQMTLTLDTSYPGVDLADVVEPEDLRGKSSTEYQPGDEARSRKLAAVVTLPTPEPAARPAVPSAEAGPVAVEAVGERSLADDLRARGVAAIFDHNLGFGILLALCVLFGAGHAFTPGHGKTMVAAYLVGERGTVWHAVVLGLTTTLTHTGSVILVALLFRLAYGNAPPALAQAWLSLAGGLLIAGVGFWLFVQRLGGRADHVHLTTAPATPGRQGWGRVILLGIGGGIVPCYDALLIFILAANRGRLGASLPMLFAFSAGLAAVLVALGVAVVYANRAGGRRFADRGWFRYLPVASAFVLMALGLWFLRDAWQGIAAANP